jgi:hypothetical protein
MVTFTQNFVKLKLIKKLKGATCINYGPIVSPVALFASLNKIN